MEARPNGEHAARHPVMGGVATFLTNKNHLAQNASSTEVEKHYMNWQDGFTGGFTVWVNDLSLYSPCMQIPGAIYDLASDPKI